MSQPLFYIDPARKPALDDKLYRLEKDELDFFQQLTGIKDENELRLHILTAQALAYEIYGYPCIRTFAFTRLRVTEVPQYKQVLELLKTKESPLFLDVGCCIGNNTRKVVLDGWPMDNVVASDLYPGFWDCGHQLFKSTPQTFPVTFVPGDIFDVDHLAPCDSASIIAFKKNSESGPTTPLTDLHSLNALRGKVSAIFAGSFFHLFDEAKQLDVALRLASLLSPEEGSVIFGNNSSSPVKGYMGEGVFKHGLSSPEATRKVGMFFHSPESWKEMWIEKVFGGRDEAGKDRVKVDVDLVEVERRDLKEAYAERAGNMRLYWMNWCITRL